jgi:hypothetical protein
MSPGSSRSRKKRTKKAVAMMTRRKEEALRS